jgi:hypothetical protein
MATISKLKGSESSTGRCQFYAVGELVLLLSRQPGRRSIDMSQYAFQIYPTLALTVLR